MYLTSVSWLGNFWKVVATIFPTKLAQIFYNFVEKCNFTSLSTKPPFWAIIMENLATSNSTIWSLCM